MGEVDRSGGECGIGGLVSSEEWHVDFRPGPSGSHDTSGVSLGVVFELDFASQPPELGIAECSGVFDGSECLGLFDSADNRHAGLDDPGLFASDLIQFASQESGVVAADAGDDRDEWLAEVCGIESSSEADFEHGPFDAIVSEVLPGERGGQFEVGG